LGCGVAEELLCSASDVEPTRYDQVGSLERRLKRRSSMQEQGECAKLGAGTAADVLGAGDALPKWTCDRVSCYGAGCGALLCFLAARELRGRAYL
jgi:hypothetical protein